MSWSLLFEEMSRAVTKDMSVEGQFSEANGDLDMDMSEMEARATSLDSPPPQLGRSTTTQLAGQEGTPGYTDHSSNPTHSIPRSVTMPSGTSRVSSSDRSYDIGARIDTFKSWSVSTFKCTRQILAEKLGRSHRTVDAEMESQIEILLDDQQRYKQLHASVQGMIVNFTTLVAAQRTLQQQFSELGQRTPDLVEEFSCNAETQHSLCKNGDQLIAALEAFQKSLATLTNRTMEDTLVTVRKYERARVEYDAYKRDMEAATAAGKAADPVKNARSMMAQQVCEQHRRKFDGLRDDLREKLLFLNENKIRVMQKQLLLFHGAVSAFFSGNQSALEETLKKFNVQVRTGNSEPSSWLERESK